MRRHDAHFTAMHVAQQTRKEARAADHAYLTTPATRWQNGGNVSFDVPIAQPSTSGGVEGHAGTPVKNSAGHHRPAVGLLSVIAGIESGPLTSKPPPITSGTAGSPAGLTRTAACDAGESYQMPPLDHAMRTIPDGASRCVGKFQSVHAGVAPGPLTHQRPGPVDCRTDRPTPAVPSVAAAGAPLYALVHYCRAAGLPEPVPEYRFHPTRMWRFDYAFPLHKIAVEVDGGVWTQGRHTRGAGYIADMEKMNAAAKLGWRVLKYTPQTLGVAIDDLRVVLA